MLALLGTLALTSSAHAAPSPTIDAVMGRSGIALPAEVRDLAYCESSQRAVLWLATGEVIAIEGKGASASIGMLPRPQGFGNRLACDRRDRVIAADRAGLVVLERGTTHTVPLADPPAQLAVTTDDRVAVLDVNGNVMAWNGRVFEPRWSTRERIPGISARISPDGSAIAFLKGGVVTVADGTGTYAGPRGSSIAWHDGAVIIAGGGRGRGLLRWRPTERAEDATVIDAQARGSLLFRVGTRAILLDSARATVRDLAGAAAPTELTRWPSGGWAIAAGQGSRFVIGAGRAAYVVDAARNGVVVPLDRPYLYVDDPAFSPDGKQLAIPDGDAVLVLDLATGKVQRLPYPAMMIAPKLFWGASGLRALFISHRVRWESGKPVVEAIGERGLALDEQGEPVEYKGLCRRGFGFRSRAGAIAARCENKVVFAAVGKAPSYTTPGHPIAFAIGGATPHLIYADGSRVMMAGLDGSVRELGTVAGTVGSIVPDATGTRLAIAHGSTITIWDLDGAVPRTVLTAENPEGNFGRLAWSADGARLAVANGLAVAVWTIGRR